MKNKNLRSIVVFFFINFELKIYLESHSNLNEKSFETERIRSNSFFRLISKN